MISIWPTVQSDAHNYEQYLQGDYLIEVDRGIRLTMQIQGSAILMDTTNPEVCGYVWNSTKKSYKDIGIDYYRVDVAGLGYAVYDFENYRYHSGTVMESGDLYPNGYLKMVYDGNKDSNESVVTLVRGAWAGVQKHDALAWSGDIDPNSEAFHNQINSGLNMGMADISWRATDIGGFHGDNSEDPEFRELMVCWFQHDTFSPILCMHGDRLLHSKSLFNSGDGSMPTGAPNEIQSYGSEVENITTGYVEIRERMEDYLAELMTETHEPGHPIMRTLFYEFPEDRKSWEIDDTYMFGSDILTAPIVNYKGRGREIYLPSSEKWRRLFIGKEYAGGVTYYVAAPLEQTPVFIKESAPGLFESLGKQPIKRGDKERVNWEERSYAL